MLRQVQFFLCAVQFLTRLPTPRLAAFEPDWTTRSARFFPLVGQIVGAISAGVLLLAVQVWGSGVLPALLAVAVGVLVTGAFHEDGLADAADGLGGGRDAAHRLEIMKDSRVGTYGVLALGLMLAIKIAALAHIPPAHAVAALVLAHGAARAAAVVAMRLLRHVSDLAHAKYKPAPDGVTTGEAAFAFAVSLWPLAGLPLPAAGCALLAGAMAALVPVLIARRLIGGYTGDVLGAIEQAFEVACLLAASALLSP